MDSEISVCESMIESYSKAVEILENCDYDNTDVSSFEIFSESYIMESARKKNKNTKENAIIRASRKMKDVIIKIIDKILSLFGLSRNNKKSKSNFKFAIEVLQCLGKDIIKLISDHPFLSFLFGWKIIDMITIRKLAMKNFEHNMRDLNQVINDNIAEKIESTYYKCLDKFNVDEQGFIKLTRVLVNKEVNGVKIADIESRSVLHYSSIVSTLNSISEICKKTSDLIKTKDGKLNTSTYKYINDFDSVNKLDKCLEEFKHNVKEWLKIDKSVDVDKENENLLILEPTIVDTSKTIKEFMDKLDVYLKDNDTDNTNSEGDYEFDKCIEIFSSITSTLQQIVSNIFYLGNRVKYVEKYMPILPKFDSMFLEALEKEFGIKLDGLS